MSVTGVGEASRDAILSAVDRLATSGVLKGSESLCRLVRYLAEKAAEHGGEPVKEYQIATEVFGRPPQFDPRIDSTVRVQTSRLRSKMAEYYAGEGAGDAIILDLPRGAYSLVVRSRPPAAPPLVPALAATRAPLPAVKALSATCLVLLAALVYVSIRRAPAAPPPPAGLRAFWQAFVDRPEWPLVVFSNAEFVGRPENGMRYFDPSRDRREVILDHYTGVGEVLAIHELDTLFNSLGHGMRLKRGRLLTLDDAKNNDLIFLGSPSENLSLRDLPTTQDFVFRLAEGERKGDLEIANLNPLPGEQKEYFSSKSLPLEEDYALIGLVPGSYSGRWVMILAGTTTIGTQAAAEYVCREREVRELLAKLKPPQPFEAVIHVKVTRGVPVASRVAALRVHPAA